jgi:hypothetical protein
MRSSSQRGVALVVTLLMLSVITFLAVAFLALTSRERQSVTLTLTQSEAKLMADAGLARAEAEIAAAIKRKTNILGAAMLVSRSYQNPLAFNSGTAGITNVNYQTVGAKGDYLQMLANLYYDPRLPVFIKTNQNGPLDFRFFVDFNRNGRFDTNGLQPDLDRNGRVILTNSVEKWVDLPGDPEFIGLLERSASTHSGTNRAVGRFAYMVLPVGQSLDLNTMHNYSKGNRTGSFPPPMLASMPGDGFNRNQGVGAYEINYAGLLMDLSSNTYSTVAYQFQSANYGAANRGTAFNDASALLRYRYANNFRNLGNVLTNFGPAGSLVSQRAQFAFEHDGVDSYAKNRRGPLTSTDRPWYDVASEPWAGSRNPVEIRDTQELLDPNKFGAPFVNHLKQMGASSATEDRHGLYRLLSQVNVGVPPALEGRINLNYTNDPTVNTFSSTYVNWDPLVFFTNVADRLIKMSLTTNNATGQIFFEGNPVSTNFGIANIPVYPATNNLYSAGLHRLLQVAANLYDATTTNLAPSVFRPVFVVDNFGGLNIRGYVAVTNAAILTPGNIGQLAEMAPESVVAKAAKNQVLDRLIVFGVPMVVGVKKGLPNFNEVQFLSRFRLQRKLEFWKKNVNQTSASLTNQTLLSDMSNEIAVELWNSYTNGYPRPVTVYCTNVSTTTIFARNFVGDVPRTALAFSTNIGRTITMSTLGPGSMGYWAGGEFKIPLQTNMVALPSSVYDFTRKEFMGLGWTNNPNGHFRDTTLATPIFTVLVTNRLRITIVDNGPALGDAFNPNNINGKVLDYVSLEMVYQTNMTAALNGRDPNTAGANSPSMWDVNGGIQRQVEINLGQLQPDPLSGDPDWSVVNTTQGERDKAANGLAVFLGRPQNPNYPANSLRPEIIYQKAAYDALGTFAGVWGWSANDPLVHYTRADLEDPIDRKPLEFSRLKGSQLSGLTLTKLNAQLPTLTLGKQNTRYLPWSDEDIKPYVQAAAFKDPMVRKSDDWNFPANKLASVGEIGRIHRGTPWQTIYLKADVAPAKQWRDWSGTVISHPTNDWRLPDLFTTAPSEEAARGLLSVNQSDYAGWSAVLSGVLAATNTTPAPALNIDPAFQLQQILPASSQLHRIVDAINDRRNRKPGNSQLFSYAGEILGVPELTTQSPFLNLSSAAVQHGLTDEMYESIPRRILSLVQLGSPRYLVYTYGQSLRPAEASLVNRFGFLNMVTNYQITGEVVTRALMRVEGTPQAPRIVIEKYDVLSTD